MLDCLQKRTVQAEFVAKIDQRLAFLLSVAQRYLGISGLRDACGLAEMAGGFAISSRICAQLCGRSTLRPAFGGGKAFLFPKRFYVFDA